MATIAGIDFRRSRTTIADVAKQAGVSTSSVSRHLTGRHVNGAAAIDAAMLDLDYRPSALARSLKSGRTDTIGLVVPDVTNPFFAGVVKGAESVAQAADYQLVLCNTDESSDREHGVLSTIRDRDKHPAGMGVEFTNFTDDVKDQLERLVGNFRGEPE